MADIKSLETAAKLSDYEREQAVARSKTIGQVTEQVEKVLLENEITFQEWGTVVDYFANMFTVFAPKLTIKEIKKRQYE